MVALEALLGNGGKITVLTGAGISAESGIPTYRDDNGTWLHSKPVQHQDFLGSSSTRQRYWARSMLGWQAVHDAIPNAAHHALAKLERAGHINLLVTQNVDRLHQKAGQQNVVDLHGRLDRVRCLRCKAIVGRQDLQEILVAANPEIVGASADIRPDGDAAIDEDIIAEIDVPACKECGGILKPDVVFFGGSVPPARVEHVNTAINRSSALLIVGSSLAVFSGYRFCRTAVDMGKPVIIINKGSTRADALASNKISADCATILQKLVRSLAAT